MRAWGLWSSRVGMYSAHELLEVFADETTAEAVRVGLIGKPVNWGARFSRWVWEDDEDFPDLYVRPLEIR